MPLLMELLQEAQHELLALGSSSLSGAGLHHVLDGQQFLVAGDEHVNANKQTQAKQCSVESDTEPR